MSQSQCRVCQQDYSRFLLRNKPLCLVCDELLLDLEIECDEERETHELSTAHAETGVDTTLIHRN